MREFTKYLFGSKAKASSQHDKAYQNGLNKLEPSPEKAKGMRNASKITETSLNSYILSLEKEKYVSFDRFKTYCLNEGIPAVSDKARDASKEIPSERMPPKIVKAPPEFWVRNQNTSAAKSA